MQVSTDFNGGRPPGSLDRVAAMRADRAGADVTAPDALEQLLQALQREQLTALDLRILRLVAAHELTIADIAQALAQPPSAIRRALARLVARGLLRRNRRRGRPLKLTLDATERGTSALQRVHGTLPRSMGSDAHCLAKRLGHDRVMLGTSSVPTQCEPSFADAASHLADVAQALRATAGQPNEAAAVADALADIGMALDDLAAGAELAAEAVIRADRPPAVPLTRVVPTRRARAVSWRLHALASDLRASREVCAAVERAATAHDG
ncbi:MAG TPA: MarR family transcriptional regulator [Solirubrobacteraceae bacterium]